MEELERIAQLARPDERRKERSQHAVSSLTETGYFAPAGQRPVGGVESVEPAASVGAAGHGARQAEPPVKPRVLVADDHRLVAAGLEQLLSAECEIVGTAHDGTSLLDQVRRLRPDIVVQDLSMPPLNGIEVIGEIKQIDPNIKVVVVTMWEDPNLAAHAFRAGASAYVLKNCAASELLEAVQCAMSEKTYVTPLIAGGMIHSLMKPSRDEESDSQLTLRQKEVLRLLAEGKSMKEVAAILNLAVGTVAFHKYRMMQQLNIKTTAELVRFAVTQHII